MNKVGFNESLDELVTRDTRYDKEAYLFLRDALDFTIKLQRKGKSGVERHVTPQELLEGIRQHALKEFGPMVLTVFHYWGVRGGEDFGNMVFNLVNAGIFGKQESDLPEQFARGYDFHTAFEEPFLPASALGTRGAAAPAQEASQESALGQP